MHLPGPWKEHNDIDAYMEIHAGPHEDTHTHAPKYSPEMVTEGGTFSILVKKLNARRGGICEDVYKESVGNMRRGGAGRD